jgi:hypothetical protein
MDPHNITGSCIAQRAPSTFSITYGRPIRSSLSRTGPIRSGWSLLVMLRVVEYPWHGGEAVITSNWRQ